MSDVSLTGRLMRAFQIACDNVYEAYAAGDVNMCHGAALMDGSRILGKGGRNTNSRNVIKGDVFPTIHAERLAIMNAGYGPNDGGKDR